MNKITNRSKVLIFGGSGLLGSAVARVLQSKNYERVLTPRSKEVNLLEKQEVDEYIKQEKPDALYMVAGLVGGIAGNQKRNADFLYQNAMMILHVLEAVKEYSPNTKILYTGSTCIYPKENPQPITEDRFLAGKFEETNKGYAMAKSLGIVGCQLYHEQYGMNCVSVMPTNLYGPNDNYDLENGHMIPSLIKKFLIAKRDGTDVTLWGSGNPRREALYSDDAADAIVYLMENYNEPEIVNIGTGFDYSIKEFAEIISAEVGFNRNIHWDTSKPEGVFEKRTDITRLKKIYPEYNPRPLNEGVRALLSNSEELKRILEE